MAEKLKCEKCYGYGYPPMPNSYGNCEDCKGVGFKVQGNVRDVLDKNIKNFLTN